MNSDVPKIFFEQNRINFKNNFVNSRKSTKFATRFEK